MKREISQITSYKSQYHKSSVPSLKCKNVSIYRPEFLTQLPNFEKFPTIYMISQRLIASLSIKNLHSKCPPKINVY